MGTRIDLGSRLADILVDDEDYSQNVYFQAPPNNMVKYPCILYRLATVDTDHANNLPYTTRKRYTVTLMDKNPDSRYVERILRLPTCSFDRFYSTDNINHWVFVIYSKEVN